MGAAPDKTGCFDGVAVALGLLFLGHAHIFRGFVIDDAFITMRYAENIALGLGAVFNAGDPVEGFSNPVLTFLLAGLYPFLPDRELLLPLARAIGVLSALASIVVVATTREARGTAGARLAALLAAASTGLALWSVAGLETTLYGFFLTIGVSMAVARKPDDAGVSLGLLLAGIALSRPEGVFPAGALLGASLLERRVRPHRAKVWLALAAAVPCVTYLLFRHSYYDAWLPNTYFAKQVSALESFRSGARYLFDYVHLNGGLVVHIGAFAALWHPRARRTARIAAAVVAAQVAAILVMGGDYMHQHRFVVPVVPLVALLVGLGWETVWRQLERVGGDAGWRRSSRLILPVGMAVVALISITDAVRLTLVERRDHYVNAFPYYTTVGRLAGAVLPSDWTIAVHDIGAIGWYGKTRVLDLFGLVDRDIARRRVSPDEAVAERLPEVLVLHYDSRHPPAARWRPLDVPDGTYVAPSSMGSVAWLPGSFRVRADRVARVVDRLAELPPDMRRELLALRAFLAERQPDGRVAASCLPP